MTDNDDNPRLTSALDRLDEAIARIETTDLPDTLMMRDLLIAAGEAVRVEVEEARLVTLDQKQTARLMVETHNEFVAWFEDLRRAAGDQ